MHTRNLVVIAAIVLASAAFAGSLTPPAGPVAPTHKTLTEVEPRTPITSLPYTITQPGSYYLTGNLTGAFGEPGITISASNVTLDLSGFTLSAAIGTFGVFVSGDQNNLVVKNGQVAGWEGAGVRLTSSNGYGARVENITASDNGVGIETCPGCIVTGCVAIGSTQHGFNIGDASVITGCTARGNGGAGVLTGSACSIVDCSASSNTSDGIMTGPHCTVRTCAAMDNGGDGIYATLGTTVIQCSVSNNIASGIVSLFGGRVESCTCSFNGEHGINVQGGSIILNNQCRANTAGADSSGIFVPASGSRIEGNNCTLNDYGIRVPNANSAVVVRNSCQGNSLGEFSIVAGNRVGTIVTTETNMNAAANDLVNIDY